MSIPCPYCRAVLNPTGLKPGRFQPKCPNCAKSFVILLSVQPLEAEAPEPHADPHATAVRGPDAPAPLPKTIVRRPAADPNVTGDFTAPGTGAEPRNAGEATAEPDMDSKKRTRHDPDVTRKPGRAAAEEPTEVDGIAPTRLGGYEVLKVLGRGGMGAVLLGRQLSLDRKVALKVMHARIATNPGFVARFTREAYAAAQLTHHNVVQIYDIGEDAGQHFFSMEFVQGRSLMDVVKTEGKLPADVAVGYALQAARGLRYGHRQGMVHRDIKPGHQARQPDAQHRGHREGDRPGAGETAGRRTAGAGRFGTVGRGRRGRRFQPDAGRGGDGHARVHVARAIDRLGERGRPGRRLLARLHPVRDDHRPAAVRGQNGTGGHQQAPDAADHPAGGGGEAGAEGAVGHPVENAGEEAGRPLPVDGRGDRGTRRVPGAGAGRPVQPEGGAGRPTRKVRPPVPVPLQERAEEVAVAGLRSGVRAGGGRVGVRRAGGRRRRVHRPGGHDPLAYFAVHGTLSGSVVFRKARAVVFGMRFFDWLAWAVGTVLLLVTLFLFGWLWMWLGFAVLAVGLAFLLWFLTDRPAAGARQAPLEETRELLKSLRLSGLEEDAVRSFVCKFGGPYWEPFYEALFGYEAMLAARASRKGDTGETWKTFGTWREPVVQWADAKVEARRLAKERAHLQKVEAKALVAEGVSQADADAQAAVMAEMMTDQAAEAQQARKEGKEVSVKELVAAVRDRRPKPGTTVAGKRHRSLWLKDFANDWFGRRLRLALGAVVFAAGLMWLHQNNLLKDNRAVAALTDGNLGAAQKAAETAGQAATKPLKVPGDAVAVPAAVQPALNTWALPLTGLLLLLNGVFYFGWKPTLVTLPGAAVALLGPAFGVPDVPPLAASQLSLAVGAVLILVAARFVRQ